MPVYLRKEEGEPSLQTPSITEFKLKDDDFILDPEILFDYLPQPYRMIDKMLELVLDITWEKIEVIEAEKARRAAERKVPIYSSPDEVPNCHDVRCMCPSPDNNAAWLYAGTSDNKLAIFDSASHELVMEWTEEPIKLKSIKVAPLGESVQVVIAEDESESCRLFVTALDKIHFVKVLNEGDTFQAKVTCVNSWLAHDATALALFVKNSNTGLMYIEFFKCPVDTWMKEIDNANQQYQKQLSSTSDVAVSIPSISFSKPSPILRVRPPQLPQGVAMSPYEMFKRAEGVVPGSGLLGHQLSLTHMEVANTAFNMLNSRNLHLLPQSETVTIDRQPQVLFFVPGRLTPVGIDNERENGRCCSVGVWWSEMYYMSVYSLLRPPGKGNLLTGFDIEHKPDSIINFGGPVHSSTLSSDNVLLAFGFSDGTVVVYDKEYGSAQQVMRANFSNTPVKHLQFVHPTLFSTLASPSKDKEDEAPLLSEIDREVESQNSSRLLASLGGGSGVKPARTNGILALSEDGTLSLCTFGKLFKSETSFLCSRDSFDTVTTGVTSFALMPGLPQLVAVVFTSGSVTVFDIAKCESVCEVFLPSTHQLVSPLSTGMDAMRVVATQSKGQFMLVHGCCSIPMKRHSNEEGGEGEGEGGEETKSRGAMTPKSLRENSIAAESTKSSSKLTAKSVKSDYGLEETLDNEVDGNEEGEAEETNVHMETHYDVFSFPLRSFKTLDKYYEALNVSNTVSIGSQIRNTYVERISLEELCRSTFNSRIVDQSEQVERLRKRWGQLRNDVSKVRNVRFNKGPSVSSNVTRSNPISAK
ncbi:WD repeat-containing protein 93-like isoform X1 [Convolutriloba macropyga]|uniref:WD repeat-containing protein 93-like isoform X1 n=1 Tax=Convolutriloba macropyga TaxID=536237 RepID=UPI003F51F0CB